MSELPSYVQAYPDPIPILDLYDLKVFNDTVRDTFTVHDTRWFGLSSKDRILATFTMLTLAEDGSIKPVLHVAREAALMELMSNVVAVMNESHWSYMNDEELAWTTLLVGLDWIHCRTYGELILLVSAKNISDLRDCERLSDIQCTYRPVGDLNECTESVMICGRSLESCFTRFNDGCCIFRVVH
jgi:hypothetical protein